MALDRHKKILLIGTIVFILITIFIINIAKYGFSGGMINIYNNFFKYSFYALIIFIAGAVAYYLFREYKVNVSEENLKIISEECAINIPSKKHFGYLWTRGDKKHSANRIGKIIGYSRRQNFKLVPLEASMQELSADDFRKKVKELGYGNSNEYIIKTRKERNGSKDETINELWYVQEEDIFMVRRGFKKIPVRCLPNQHSELCGDVYLYCIGLVKHSCYYYPNTMHLDFDSIDLTQYNEGLRYTQQHFLDNMVNILRKATGLSKEEQMEVIQGKSGMQIVKEKMGK